MKINYFSAIFLQYFTLEQPREKQVNTINFPPAKMEQNFIRYIANTFLSDLDYFNIIRFCKIFGAAITINNHQVNIKIRPASSLINGSCNRRTG